MQILIITARSDYGGGPRHIELLMMSLHNDFLFHIACPDEEPYQSRFSRLANGRVYFIPHRKFSFIRSLRLASYVRFHRIDLIHTHGKGAGIYGRLLAMLTGVPCLHSPHGVHEPRYGYFGNILYNLYERLSSRFVRYLIFVSKDEACVATSQGIWKGIPYKVIENGVENADHVPSLIQRKLIKRQLGIPENGPLVATISRFDYAKNMEEGYLVAKTLPNVFFLWVGDGEHATELKRRASQDGLKNLIFFGSTDNPRSVLVAADVYLTTSRSEGLPLSVLEAMSVGLPVLASDVPGHRELITGSGGGWLYRLGNVWEAVTKLTRLIHDDLLRMSLGNRGRSVQRNRYSVNQMANTTRQLYLTIITSPNT